ncbi:MAG: NAD-dependent epimerase/dehydratase family protein, partial [Chloroflexota bacterium]|nr:NAD-dependent epimerase/dehydratase family protein [Chloroflexota bacterium]
MNVLVTGATGFIGNSLVDRLIKMGYEVIPIGRSLKLWSSDFIRENILKID